MNLPAEPQKIARRAANTVRWLNYFGMAIALMVLLGWQLEIPLLKTALPGYVTMKVNTAIGLLLLGLAAQALARPSPSGSARGFAFVAAVITIAIGVLTLSEYLFSVDFRLDELFYADPDGVVGKFPPGRLAPITAVNFFLIGVSVVRSALWPLKARKSSDFFVLMAFVLSFQGFVGYLSGVSYSFGSAFYTQMAVHTAVGFICICMALLFANARDGFIGLLVSDNEAGFQSRRLVASAVMVPPMVNFLQLLGQRAHLYDTDFGVLLRIVGDTVFYLVVVWRTSSTLQSSDSRMQASEIERQMLEESLREREQIEKDIVTAREFAQEASRLKSEFLANMSHEIRTPINGVIGMASMLADTPLSPQQSEYLEYIGRSADALLTVINDILDFSKVEAGKLELEMLDFDLEQVVSDVTKTMAFAAERKGLKFVVSDASDLKFLLQGDHGRLRQVLLNLLSNAIKFTTVGSVDLRITKEPAVAGSTLLLFAIEDTGIGIPETTLPRLFSAFHQADTSTTRRFGGTGLGLSICKKLVELMGGTLGVESTEGKGSRFWFKLAFQLGADRIPPPLGPLAPVAHKTLPGARILVAEDNVINQKVVLALLEKFGYKAIAVANGKEACQALVEVDYTLVLMDCQMPVMDGYEAAEYIRASTEVKNRSVPIIALTANAIKGSKERCLAAGMNGYISKPIKAAELSRLLEQWLGQEGDSKKVA